jgi:uncharacterized protein (TIGR03084 family)
VTDLAALLADLRAEAEDLDQLVAALDAGGWDTPTPATGWTVAHQVSHLAWTDRLACLATRDPAGFEAELRGAAGDPLSYVEAGAAEGASEPPDLLLDRWRRGRGELLDLLATTPSGTRLPWFGPPMKIPSMATARIMELFAHGQDVADALGVRRTPTARLRHVAHLGVRTRDFGFLVHGLTVPPEEFRVELAAPDGTAWAWGPPEAGQRVTGPALDFCLLVTQRRHRVDLDVRADGADVDRWLDVVQCFAGPPGTGRAPGQFR